AVALALAAEDGPLAIGGESAGANLAVVTLLRLRDRHGLTPFRAAALVAGFYDLTQETDPELEALVDQYAPSSTLDDLVRADLRALPEALFVVGSADPLLDDTLRLADRWPAARLVVLEDAPHDVDATEQVN